MRLLLQRMMKLHNELFMDRKAETYVQKVFFSFSFSLPKFKFIADIDEISPSEDEEAAQRVLHAPGDGDLGAEGSILIFNRNLDSYSNSNSLQILMRTPPRNMVKLRIVEWKTETYLHKVLLLLLKLSLLKVQVCCR